VWSYKDAYECVDLFDGLSPGQQHNLDRAVRAFFRFYEVFGVSREYLDGLRRAIPKEVEFVDLKILSEEQIVSSLGRLLRAPLRHQAFTVFCLILV